MTYREQSFATRLATLGDPAENAFIEMMTDNEDTFEVFGWRRPTTGMGQMTQMLRNMPDFYTGKGWLVEVMGCGRDGILKGLKVPKWASLRDWNEVQRLCFWVWNSSTQRGVWVAFDRMSDLVARSVSERGVQAFENDGNEYYELPWAWLTGDEG